MKMLPSLTSGRIQGLSNQIHTRCWVYLRCIRVCKDSTSVHSMKLAAGIKSSLHLLLRSRFLECESVSFLEPDLWLLCVPPFESDLNCCSCFWAAVGKAVFLFPLCECDTSNMFLPIPSCGLVLY